MASAAKRKEAQESRALEEARESVLAKVAPDQARQLRAEDVLKNARESCSRAVSAMYERKLLRDSFHHNTSAVRAQFEGQHVHGLDASDDEEEADDDDDDDEGDEDEANGTTGIQPQQHQLAGTAAMPAGNHQSIGSTRHHRHLQVDGPTGIAAASTSRIAPHPPPDPRAASTARRASLKDARVKFAADPAASSDGGGGGDGDGNGSRSDGGRNLLSPALSAPLPMQAQVRLATSHGPHLELHSGSSNSMPDGLAKAAAAASSGTVAAGAGAAYAATAPSRVPWPTTADIKQRLGWQASSQVLGASRRARRASTSEVGVFKDPVLAEMAAAAAVAEAAQGTALPGWAARTVTLTNGQAVRVRLERARFLHLLHNGADPAAFVAAAAGLSNAASAAAAAEAMTEAEAEGAEAVLAAEAEAVAVACGADDGTSSASPPSSGRLLQVPGGRLQSLQRRSFGALARLPSIGSGGGGSSSNMSVAVAMAAATAAAAAADVGARPPTALSGVRGGDIKRSTSQANTRPTTGTSVSASVTASLSTSTAPSSLSFRSSLRSGGGTAVAAAINAAYGGGGGGAGVYGGGPATTDDLGDSAGVFGCGSSTGAALRAVERTRMQAAAAAEVDGKGAAAASYQLLPQPCSPHPRRHAGANSGGGPLEDGLVSPYGAAAAAAAAAGADGGDGYGGGGQAPSLPHLSRSGGGASKGRRASLDEAWLAAQAGAGGGGAQAVSRWMAMAAVEAGDGGGAGAAGGGGGTGAGTRAPPRARHSLLQLRFAGSEGCEGAGAPVWSPSVGAVNGGTGVSPSGSSYTPGSGVMSRGVVLEATMRSAAGASSVHRNSTGLSGWPSVGAVGGGCGGGGGAFGLPDRRAVSYGGPSPQHQPQQPSLLLSTSGGAAGTADGATGTAAPGVSSPVVIPPSFRQSYESGAGRAEGGSGHRLVTSLLRALRGKK